MKRTAGAARIVSDTGIWGVGRMLYGDSSTFNGNATPYSFSRRQNSSLFYDTPNFSGFQGYVGISSTSGSTGQTANSLGQQAARVGRGGNVYQRPVVRHAGV